VSPAKDLLRLTAAEDRVQLSGTSRGRGAWVHPRAECVQAAVRSRAFARAFRRNVIVPAAEDLIRAIEAMGGAKA
jgi:predicted RNA-binding protein YlxR (DUF448 family)